MNYNTKLAPIQVKYSFNFKCNDAILLSYSHLQHIPALSSTLICYINMYIW